MLHEHPASSCSSKVICVFVTLVWRTDPGIADGAWYRKDKYQGAGMSGRHVLKHASILSILSIPIPPIEEFGAFELSP